jgi:hypothetical protein
MAVETPGRLPVVPWIVVFVDWVIGSWTMSAPDGMDNLSWSEQEILGLWTIVVQQQVKLKLHESLLESILAPTLRGRSLEAVCGDLEENAIQNTLAGIADNDPTKASCIARLLAQAKQRATEEPPLA